MTAAFRGRLDFCSNFYQREVVVDGERYASTEHAYQSLKLANPEDRLAVRLASTAAEAKRLARHSLRRPELELGAARVTLMRTVVRAKFEQHPDLAARLLATGDEELVEHNTWGDQFWGMVDGVGLNHLGRILMDIRAQLVLSRPVPASIILLVSGSRKLADTTLVWNVLDAVHRRRPISLLMEGGAEGADALAARWARDHELPHLAVPARWSALGKAAGPIRNRLMLDFLGLVPQLLVAFPEGGPGTADMIKAASGIVPTVLGTSATFEEDLDAVLA